MTPIQNANYQIASHLLESIPTNIPNSNDYTSPSNLVWMMNTVMSSITSFPDDKTGRWIGFVQGVLTCSGLLDVDSERDFSRPIYHEAYNKSGLNIPPTLNSKRS